MTRTIIFRLPLQTIFNQMSYDTFFRVYLLYLKADFFSFWSRMVANAQYKTFQGVTSHNPEQFLCTKGWSLGSVAKFHANAKEIVFLQHFAARQTYQYLRDLKHYVYRYIYVYITDSSEFVHLKFQVNDAVFSGATCKKVYFYILKHCIN